ncbi:GAF domain-containing protein [Gordonia phosphorivorans]|uniref:GAF domain-containing protein n=1 Tax=Gordonia phosphorivorans TaxID=1056982 RepID=A0ABV6HAB9_9ACTN
MGWQLIECIDPERPPSIVWKDGQAREWVSLAQVSRKDGFDSTVVSQLVAAARAIEPPPFHEREAEPLFDTVIEGHRGPLAAIVHQVVDPTNVVRGLLLWIGAPGEEPEPRPRSAGMLWSGQVFNSQDTFMLRASDLSRYGKVSRTDQFFNRVVRFPDLPRVVDLCSKDTAEAGQPLLSKVTLLHDDQRLINLQIAVRRYGDTVAATGLDITAWEQPTMDPATVARLQSATPAGHSVAIIAFRADRDRSMPTVVYWVTPPPPWMAYWSGEGPYNDSRSLIHRDDLDALLAAHSELLEGEAVQVVSVRIRTSAGQWRTLPVTLTKYPQAENYLCVMTAAFEE